MIPTYNEEENARPIYEAVRDELQKSCPAYDYEILFIDNKSTDEPPLLSATDGTIGLDCLERFSKVVINFREMYIEGIKPKENNL